MCRFCYWSNCIKSEDNPDFNISLYASFELEAMLRRILEIEGKIDRTSLLLGYPPFSKDELEEELKSRSKSD